MAASPSPRSPEDGESNFDRLRAQTISPPSQLSGPTSLAHFIGGNRDITNQGNRLGIRKPGQDADPNISNLEVDSGPTRTFLSGGRVPLPGMTRPSEVKRAESSSDNDAAAAATPRTPPVKSSMYPLHTEKSAMAEQPAASKPPWEAPSRPIDESPAAAPHDHQHQRMPSTPHQHIQEEQENDEKGDKGTASLNRLRSSNLVKQRLEAWPSEAQDTPTKSPSHQPTVSKRNSVLDRWNRDEPDAPASPAAAAATTTRPSIKTALSSESTASSTKVQPRSSRVSPISGDGSSPSVARTFQKSPADLSSPSPPTETKAFTTTTMDAGASDTVKSPVEAAQTRRPSVSLPPFKRTGNSFRMSDMPSGPQSMADLLPGSVVSVETLSLGPNDSVTTIPEEDAGILYDSELVAIVHHLKSSSAQKESRCFLWHGSKARIDQDMEHKAQDLAQRYSSALIEVHQGDLDEAKIALLFNNRLVVRQGARDDFGSSNSRLYCVREVALAEQDERATVTLIDEVPLSARSVSSGFSYVLCVIGSTAVWHGRHAAESEQDAALRFATRLARESGQRPSIETEDGSAKGLFWDALAPDEREDSSILWRWKSAPLPLPKVYELQGYGLRLSSKADEHSIAVIDIGLEVFVVVPRSQRGARAAIDKMLSFGETLSASQRGPRPVHTLVFPTVVPTGLSTALRSFSALQHLNEGVVPDKMHVMSLAESREALARDHFSSNEVQDPKCLPLGVGL